MEGIAIAKAKYIKFSRRVEFKAFNYVDIYTEDINAGEISVNEAMQSIGCGRCTFYRMINELKENVYI